MQIKDNVLIAEKGMKITDSNDYYSRVVLSNIDTVDRYTEITVEDMNMRLEAEEVHSDGDT